MSPTPRPPLRAVDPAEAPVPNLTPGMWAKLPDWGKVLIIAVATATGGAGFAGFAKFIGLQTAAQAAADKVELKAAIEKVVEKQQTSDHVDATNHAAVLKAIEEIKAAQSRQGARLEAVRAALKKGRPQPADSQ